jgi:predicted pyridoxine 5'-phosphate oxidase superfamily flavin-nucleotide-binding protein
MQSIDTAKYHQADRLRQLIGELRNEPGTDLKTLRRVEAKVNTLAGVRMTVGKGRKIDSRIAAAKIIATGLPPTAAVRRIAAALGVCEGTGWRYLRRIRLEQST